MSVEASGDFARVVDEVQDLIANTATFQSMTGSANATVAKDRTYATACGDPAAELPLAIVKLVGAFGTRESSSTNMDVEWEVQVAFHEDADNLAQNTDADDERLFVNRVGAVFSEGQALQANSPGVYPAVEGFRDLEFVLPDPDNAHGGRSIYSATLTYVIAGHST